MEQSKFIYCLHHQLMLEAINTSEKLINFYQTTRHNIPEDSHLHTSYYENLNSHLSSFSVKLSMNYTEILFSSLIAEKRTCFYYIQIAS
jgi:hypothetical protein